MKLPIPTNSGIPYIGNLDAEGNLALPTEQYILSGGVYVPVSVANPLPSKDNDAGSGATGITIPTGGLGKLGWLSGIYDKLSKALTVVISGGITTVTHTVASVTSSSGLALASNVNRKYALLVNDSSTDQYIKLGETAVNNQGIRLNAGGGSYEISAVNNNLYTGVINIISTWPGDVLITEGV